ncbi:MAG: hypothetical protein WAO76_10740, partial [Georgfuchsia sp.]
QTIIAEKLAELGIQLLLEASVKDLRAMASGESIADEYSGRGGRIDIAVYYQSKMPRFLIEIKKITDGNSLAQDHKRIVEMLHDCPTIQNGLMIGYTTAAKADTVRSRLEAIRTQTNSRIVRRLPMQSVKGKRGQNRILGAAVYRVDRNARLST